MRRRLPTCGTRTAVAAAPYTARRARGSWIRSMRRRSRPSRRAAVAVVAAVAQGRELVAEPVLAVAGAVAVGAVVVAAVVEAAGGPVGLPTLPVSTGGLFPSSTAPGRTGRTTTRR